MRLGHSLQTRTQGRGSRLLKLVLVLVRVLVIMVTVEVSGAGPALAEVISYDDAGDAGCCSDCPIERSGKECPPGCPNCHCSHGGVVAMPQRFEDTLARVVPIGEHVETAPHEARVPRAPPLPSVYRPPRPVTLT